MAKPKAVMVTVKLTLAELEMILLALKWATYGDDGHLYGTAYPERLRLKLIRMRGGTP